MRGNIIGALILALGLVVGGYLAGGRYEIVSSQGNAVAKLDRVTGEVTMCVVGAGCGYKLDQTQPHALNSN
jgi:hypothetical protein